MLEEADRDGDGMLNFEEFYRIMRRRGDPLDDFDSDDEWFDTAFLIAFEYIKTKCETGWHKQISPPYQLNQKQ